MKGYVDAAELGGKTGACHIFRHSMATAMLANGCDVRLLQEILGHAEMSTTAICTRVSIGHLVRAHAQTHPASRLVPPPRAAEAAQEAAATPEQVLAALDEEADDEASEGSVADDDERARLHAALDKGIAAARAGDHSDAEDFVNELLARS